MVAPAQSMRPEPWVLMPSPRGATPTVTVFSVLCWRGTQYCGCCGACAGGEPAARDCVSVGGLIEDVVLLGAPIDMNKRKWAAARRVVAGRLVNVHSGRDLVLALLFRYNRLSATVAGTSAVRLKGVGHVENVDASSVVHRHGDYPRVIPEILAMIDLEVPTRDDVAHTGGLP